MIPGLPHLDLPENFQMINSVEIKNFRGFEEARLSNCRRINLIVGDNGGGKTSLLEALFLCLGNSPSLAVRLRGLRGLDNTFSGPTKVIEDAISRNYFYDFDKKRTISIQIEGSHFHSRSLMIAAKPVETTIPLIEKSDDAGAETIVPATFHFQGPDAPKEPITLRFVEQNLRLPPVPELTIDSYYFASNHMYSAQETASRFSTLSKKFRAKEFTKLIRQEFGMIEDLTLEVVAGAAVLHTKLAGRSERVPINFISGGLTKVMQILLAIPVQPGCVVLIDEIENALYYKRLGAVWKTLLAFCKQYNAQVFASTHSAECLLAAAQLAEKTPGDFSVIHAAAGMLRQFGGDKFVDAMEENVEIR